MKTRKNKIFVAAIIALAMMLNLTSVFAAISTSYSTPSVNPPSGVHPRVLFTASDIAGIKAVIAGENDENSSSRTWFRRRVDNRAEDNSDNAGGDCSESTEGWNVSMLSNIEAKALAYVLGETVYYSVHEDNRETTPETAGALAVQYLLQYLNTCDLTKISSASNRTRPAAQIMLITAEVYDWCYPLLTTEQKNTIINLVETKLANKTEMGWPPINQGAVVGHGAESQLLQGMLAFAIATYDERPDIWRAVGGRFYQEFVPVRNRYLKSSYNLQGSEYGNFRSMWDLWSYLLITGMGAASPYDADATAGLKELAYQQVYSTRPDGQNFRDGDDPDDDKYDELFSSYVRYVNPMVDSAINADPYLKTHFIEHRGEYYNSALLQIVVSGKYNTTSLKAKSLKNLPNTRYFQAPANVFFTRTGWNVGPTSADVAATIKFPTDFVGNHQHYDAGSFQLYYKGILASDSGIYQGANTSNSSGGSGYESPHRKYYAVQTVAHNNVLIGNANQKNYYGITSNEPATLSEVQKDCVASVDSYDVDQTNPNKPSYSYIKGDLKNAYSSVSGYKRYFMFLDLKRDDVPAALIVYDYINASGTKRWLLHGQQQPTTSNGQTVFTNTASDESGSYNGKMTVDTLLPTSPSISIVGGANNYSKAANGTNYETAETGKVTEEGNTYRMEISSSGSQFLNVIQVSDADKNNYLSVGRIGGSYVAGVQIADRVVTFNKDGAIFTSDFNFEVPSGGTHEFTVCDVKRGAWKVSTDSSFATYDIVGTTDDSNGNVLHFTKQVSSHQTLYFQLVNGSGGFSGSGLSPAERTLGTPTLYDFATIYTKVLGESERTEFTTRNDAIFDSNGKPMVAAADIAEILDANLSISGNTATFTKDGKTCSFTIGSATMNKGGDIVDKSEEATPAWINGTFYISPISISAYYYAALQISEDEITFTPDAADGDMRIEYSEDGINYEELPDFDENTTDYDVDLPRQITAPYIRIVNSLGAQYFSVSNSAEDEPGQDGKGDWSNATDASKEQYSLERFLSNGNTMESARVPIKNDYGTARIYYTAPGSSEQTVYTVKFHSAQPKLTYLSTNMADNVSGSIVHDPVYIRGAAVWNDNGTILDTKIGENNGRTWAMANVSPSLQGASMFMLPITPMMATSRNTGSSPDEGTAPFRKWMFKFKTDCPGRVVVLMANAAGEGSGYLTDASWHAGTNNGQGINGVGTTSSVVTKETLNPSGDAQYHAIAYKWISAAYTAEDKDENLYRTYYPGVVSAPTHNTYTKDNQKLTYSYYKDFDEGDEIVIPNPLNLIQNNEKNDIMGVFVIYEDDPTPPPAEDIQITYTTGKGGYRTVSGVKDNKTEYSVTLPDYSKYAYVSLAVPEGQEAPTAVTYSNEFHGVEGSSLVGTDGALATNSNQQAQCWIPARTDSSGNYIVPIKNENAELHFTYEDEEGTSRDYTVSFTAKQERLTEFTDNTSLDYAGVVFIGGAAANNDNGTITETSARGNPSTIRAIGNISKELVGSSIFMLPNMGSSDYATGNTVFSFRADHDGNVVIMSDTNFAGASVYESGEEGWSRVNNTNWGKNYVSLSNKALNQSRAYNDYSGVDYLAISTKWHIQSYTAAATGYNLYRLDDPGVDGNTTVDNSAANASTAGSWYMSRAYKKHFKAGDLVEIKGWGGSGSQDMAIFVQWCEDEDTENVIDIKYSVDNENFASLPNVEEGKLDYKVIMPDNAKYAYVKFDVPQGVDAPKMLYTSWSVHNTDYETGEALVGTDGAMGTNSFRQTQVPMNALESNGAYVVPIKSEKGVLSFMYKNRPYTITFVAKQPRITELNDYTGNEYGNVIYVSGAAANNNNGTVTITSERGTGAQKIRAIGNISEALVGASIFMLPSVSATDDDLFSFVADHGGTIVVMNDSEITNSAYSSWTQRNNGTIATNVGLGGGDNSSGRMTKSREFNNYGNKTDPSVYYYAVSTAWYCEGCSGDRWGYNAFRSYYPGIAEGTKTNSKCTDCDNVNYSTAGSWAMKYCYSKTFAAGDIVTVPGWGTDNSSPDSTIFVIWDDAEAEGAAYVVEDGKVEVGADVYEDADKVITAIYDENGVMTDISIGTASINVGEIDEDDTREIGMFITNLRTLEPIFSKRTELKNLK